MLKNRFSKIISLLLILAFSTSGIVFSKEISDEEMVKIDESSIINESIDASVIIDESNIIRPADDRMLGIQYETVGQHSVLLAENSIELSQEYKDMAKRLYKIPVARMGGTSIEAMNFLNNVGPIKSRKPSSSIISGNAGTDAQTIGPVEWIKSVLENNPAAEFVPCISMTSSTPADNAHFAQFLLDPADKSEWGALRARCGLKDPVNVAAFEMGNEIDGGTKGWIYSPEKLEWYKKTARENIDAIRAAEPEAKLMICGKTAPSLTDPDWRKWTVGILEAVGKDIDYMSYHLYYSGYELAYTEPIINGIRDDLYTVLGKDTKVKIIITEHAKWFSEEGSSDMISLKACLATGQFLSKMYVRPEVWGATYHSFSANDNWWSIFKLKEGKNVEMGLAHMYKAYQKYIGDRIISVEMQSDSKLTDVSSTAQKFSVLATPKGKRELNVILTNREPNTTFKLNFKFNNKYKLVEETVFTAPNVNSYVNSLKNANVFTTTTTEKSEDNFTTYLMPNKSVVFLKLVSNTDLPVIGETEASDNEVVFSGNGKFNDIDYHWAKNEISLMSEAGFVKGVTETEFQPQSNITRAETATILSRVLGLKTEESSANLFKDVNPEDWYSGYITALFGEGLIRGDENRMFNPNNNVTLEDLLTIAFRTYKNHKLYVGNSNADLYLQTFEYKDDISDSAKEAVVFAIEKGLINKLYEDGKFEPKKHATRAQAAVILYRLYKQII